MSGGTQVFKAFGSVFLEGADKTKKDMDGINKKGSGLGTSLGKVGKGIGIASAAVGGFALAGAAALFKLGTKIADAGDRVDKLSQKLGFSRDGFQEWEFVLSQNGMSIDVLKGGMKTLTNQVADLKDGVKLSEDAFAQLGIKYEDLEGMTQEEIFNTTIAALQGVEDVTQRAAIANDLLGRSGVELSPLLNQTAESVENLKTQAQEMGMVMSDETIDAGVSFTDTMDKLKRTLAGLISKSLTPLMPLIEMLAEDLAAVLPPLIELIAPLIGEFAPILFDIIKKLLPPLSTLLLALIPILEPLLNIFLVLIDTALIPLINLFVKIIDFIMPPLTAALNWIAEKVIPFVITWVKKLFDTWKNIFGGIGDIIKGIVKLFKGDFTGAIEKFGGAFKKIFGAIGSFYKNIINGIIRGINAFIGAVNKISINIPDWVPLLGGKSFGFNFKTIPLLADGGNIQKSGMAIVGEAGAELVDLPGGATVTPLTGGSPLLVINNPKFFNQRDVDRMMKPVINTLRVKGVNPA